VPTTVGTRLRRPRSPALPGRSVTAALTVVEGFGFRDAVRGVCGGRTGRSGQLGWGMRTEDEPPWLRAVVRAIPLNHQFEASSLDIGLHRVLVDLIVLLAASVVAVMLGTRLYPRRAI
jgi:hypothetical protein